MNLEHLRSHSHAQIPDRIVTIRRTVPYFGPPYCTQHNHITVFSPFDSRWLPRRRRGPLPRSLCLYGGEQQRKVRLLTRLAATTTATDRRSSKTTGLYKARTPTRFPERPYPDPAPVWESEKGSTLHAPRSTVDGPPCKVLKIPFLQATPNSLANLPHNSLARPNSSFLTFSNDFVESGQLCLTFSCLPHCYRCLPRRLRLGAIQLTTNIHPCLADVCNLDRREPR